VDYDVGVRTEGYTQAEVQTIFDALDEDFGADGLLLQNMLEAYADGVNTRMAEVRDDQSLLPAEYFANELEIVDWAPTDTIYMVVLQLRRFGETAGSELQHAALLQKLQRNLGRSAGKDAFRDLAWRNDPNSYTTIPSSEGTFDSPDPGAPDADAVAIPDAAGSLVAAAQARTTRMLPSARSSNFAAVSPALSESGNTLHWGGPQVGYNVPQFFMEIDMHSPTFDIRGPALPGASLLVPLGRGIAHAWSLTTGSSDGVDVRVEQLCEPGGGAATQDSNGYLFDGECVEMTSRTETVEVKDGDPVMATIHRTVHGPVFDRGSVDGRPVAFTRERAFWMQEADSVISFLRAGKNTVDSVDDFSEAMSTATMAFNAVYVDDTDIGYFHVGKYPIRAAGTDPMLPSWGTGEWEWQGFVPFADLPHMVNPAQGWLVNWNNQPSAGWDNGDQSVWGPTQRVKLMAQRFKGLFRNGGKAELSDVVDVIRDVATIDGNAALLGPRMLRRAGSPSGTTRDALAAVAEWIDGGSHRLDRDRNEKQDYGIAVATWDKWYSRLVHAIFDDELKGAYDFTIPIADDAPSSNGSAYYSSLSNHLWNLFGSTKDRLSRDYCDDVGTSKTETCSRLIRSTLRKTVAALSRRFGSNLSRWSWPADYIEFSEVGAVSVDPIPWQNRGTYNQAIEVLGL
jgi:acyl-homoserine lactone acylase PvdQ